MSLLTDYARDRFPEVAAKAPDESTLEAYMRDRFPELAAKADAVQPQRTGPPGPMGKYGGVPGDQFDLEPTGTERIASGLESFGQNMTQSAIDYPIQAFNTVMGRGGEPTSMGGKLAQAGANVGIGAGKGLIGTGADLVELMSGGRGQATPDFRAALAPDNTAQQVGEFGERVAEFVLPAGKLGAASRALNTGKVATAAIDVAGNAGLSLAVDALHGEDMETAQRDALIAGGIPLLGHTVGAALVKGGKGIVNQFFPKARTEAKLRISRKDTADVLADEGIRGLRGQTVIKNIDDTIDSLDASLANKIVTAADTSGVGTGRQVTILPKIETLFNRARSVAKARTEGTEALNTIDEGLSSIRGAINRMKGTSAELPYGAVVTDSALNARQLNNLRRHVNELLKETAPTADTYRRTLIDVHRAIKSQLETLAPGAKAELSRISELIGTKHNFQQKLDALSKRELVTLSDLGTTALTAVNPAVGAPVALAKGAHKLWQYTPGRLMASRALQATGNAPGRVGMGMYAGTKGMTDAPADNAVTQPLTAPFSAQQPQQPALLLQDPKEQKHFDESMPVVSQYDDAIDRAAQSAGLDPLILKALVIQESGALGPTAKSKKGAYGLTQVMRPALEDLGMQDYDLTDPEVQLVAGAKYLKRLLDHFNGNMTLALAAYNGGIGNVTRAKGVPNNPETRAYVPKVLRYYVALGGTTSDDQQPIGGL